MNEGHLLLHLVRDGGGRTRLARRRQCYPLTTTAVLPLAEEDTALIYVQNAAGSVFGGDRLSVDIRLDEGAELCLSTPAATRLQGDVLSVQTTRISVARNGFLESVPDMVIPHAGACHHQITRLAMERDASAILLDSMAPGRVARGERHDYALVLLRLVVMCEGRDILIDGARFCPAEADPALAGALGEEGYVGALFALSAQVDSVALAADIAASLDGTQGAFGGAAPLASGYGVVARFLAADAPALRAASHRAWDAARRRMRNRPAPVLRK
ncbi:urease accessory protein UreD [Paracoccus sp. pheM1]|uniref:urease accessory protein UreD n=1 Tax=Paracoccus sp. pheM1 TaxID=2831675 RepID=UPI001BDB9528|nr:urease accessory protein UreD [Paracoccus sp. pheM1]MBT0781343.1 urease accessory protein UreD [Paracoccus sp. pheM1]